VKTQKIHILNTYRSCVSHREGIAATTGPSHQP
jgi:hypothetical protein